jgi:hypothetical protein
LYCYCPAVYFNTQRIPLPYFMFFICAFTSYKNDCPEIFRFFKNSCSVYFKKLPCGVSLPFNLFFCQIICTWLGISTNPYTVRGLIAEGNTGARREHRPEGACMYAGLFLMLLHHSVYFIFVVFNFFFR